MGPASRARPRPGGRSERNRAAVAEAVLDLLREGRCDLGAAAVADRAGIHRSTVYRRWPTAAALIREALTVHTAALAIADTGAWESDLRAIASGLAELFADPAEVTMNAALATHDDPAVAEVLVSHWMPIVLSVVDVVRRAKDRGEVSPDVEAGVVVELLVSPLLVRTTFLRQRPAADHVERLVAAILRLTRPDQLRPVRSSTRA